ncbi:CHAT domain-containing protein [Saccharopolyspora subtropica]|uniref:CHAT domain-containing protein n=1 Tax=Saccharopolyspora thermophila TaxID=89367 RepID=A0A917JZD5_9PSEU|nr:CHAT domain-containing protein [Saccharopolyspora subtropica]GGI93756.1 CHAT domain-containing protein [Saccharopolyspora subtropica]
MTDDASRANDRFRGLQRWAGGQDRGGSSRSSWFVEEPTSATAAPAEQAADPRRSAEQRYADAIAAMNKIVTTLDFGDLPWVTEVFRATASVLHDSDPARAGVLNNLGSAAQLNHLRSGELADLEDAIGYYRSATAAARSDDHDRVLYRCNLVLALTEYAAKTGSATAAAESVELARETAEQTPRRDQRRAMVLIRLANALKLHARLANAPESDDESIDVFREAARLSPARESTTSELLINLGAALLRRYERDDSPDDLDEGIKHLGAGAGALPDGEPRRSALCHLANALRLRFRRNGDLTDLNSAISELIGVLGVLDTGHPLLGTAIWNLAAATVEHVDATGEAGQLRRVLRLIGPAVRAMSADDPQRAAALTGYATLLRRHFVHGAEAEVLDTAVTAGEAAVEAAAETDRGSALNSLVATLITRFDHNGDSTDLDRAAELAREAAADADPAARHVASAQLGTIAMHRYRTTAQTGEVETAIELFELALFSMPATAPGRAHVAIQLGRALQAMHQRSGRRRYYRWARKVLTDAAEQHNAPADLRLRAASLCGRIAAQAHRWSEALEAFALAVELLPLVTRGKRVVASPTMQQRWALIVADAAACALENGEPERAVELLEHGRTAILADFLPTGGELGELHRTHPDLADEVVRLRRLLDRPVAEPGLGETDDRLRLAATWDELLAEVRAVQPGHLRPTPFAELTAAVPEGSVVLVNLSRYRSDALVVIGGRVLTVPLPKADPELAAEQAGAMLSAAQHDDHEAIADGLDWVWHRIARPVLERMGYLSTPEPGSRWPRMWWSAVGATAFLPVHAATAKTGECALDHVVSSYTPTLGCLLRAGQRPVPESGTALVAAGSAKQVAMELPPQNQVLAQYWPSAEIVSVEHTSAAEVLRMLPKHPWLHVCEPSSQFPAQPAAGLLLDREAPQRPLGLVEIGQVPLDRAEFCYVGQCATAADPPSAAAVSLPGALNFAGFTHVLGTLWEVDEDSAVQVHADVYDELFGGEADETDRAAYALHNAARRLREHYPQEHGVWSAHVHVGP